MPSRRRRLPVAQAVYQASIDALHYLKRRQNYRSLAAMIGISPSTLSRYLSGKTLPRSRRATTLLEKIVDNIRYDEVVAEFFGSELDVENGIQISHDIEIIKLLSSYVLRQYMGSKVDAVLATDMQVIPLATCFASLTNAEIYYMLDRPLWRESVEVSYRVEGGLGRVSLWMPKSTVKRGKSLLLMATLVTSHSPYREIFSLLRDKKAYAAGLFAITSKKSVWATLSVTPGCKKVVVKLYQ